MAGFAGQCQLHDPARQHGRREHLRHGHCQRIPALSAIWAPENNGTPEDFFKRWASSSKVTLDLKLKVTTGATLNFTAVICSFAREGSKWFVMQLLPETVTGPVAASVPVPASARFRLRRHLPP